MERKYKNKIAVLKMLGLIRKYAEGNEKIHHKRGMDAFKSGRFNLKPCSVKDGVLDRLSMDDEFQKLKSWLEGYKVGFEKAKCRFQQKDGGKEK